jgi:hypothetical protein
LFEEMPAATAASAHQQASASQFADMIVHRLSGQFHASGDARRGIALEEGGENLQPKWMMEQDSSLGRFANKIETGAALGRGGVRGAGAGDFPIAGTGDAHGFEAPLSEKREHSFEWTNYFVKNYFVVYSRSDLTGTLRMPLAP